MRQSLTLLSITVVLAACSGAGSDATTTTSLAVATTSTTVSPATTTSTIAPTTTTTEGSTSTTGDDPLAPDGSGCTPGTAELPDGEWYGNVDAYDAAAISFDLACWFTGEAAVTAAAEDGEESPPPNDYYVRNENDEIRILAVNPSLQVTWYPSGDPNDVVQGTFTEWVEYRDSAEFGLGVWVTIDGGQVTVVEEKWVP